MGTATDAGRVGSPPAKGRARDDADPPVLLISNAFVDLPTWQRRAAGGSSSTNVSKTAGVKDSDEGAGAQGSMLATFFG